MHWELAPKNLQIALLFWSWRHERQFGGFQRSKKCAKRWSKTGSLNVKILFLKGLIGQSTFRARKIDVSKRHLLRALKPPPYPLRKKQLLSEERRTNEEEEEPECIQPCMVFSLRWVDAPKKCRCPQIPITVKKARFGLMPPKRVDALKRDVNPSKNTIYLHAPSRHTRVCSNSNDY